jgi:flagellin-like hook-associated protein FlgL
MSLVINNNMMAASTARTLGNTYDRLATSTARLSSGLRINSAADDAAGLAIRELMRSDIATMQQGIRNAADGISMLQTAEGAMAVIDEKLTRMKELAEQAATGTYTTVQREIINSEYQAMAAEIDRIANATEFNGVKLLDGSISAIHQGKGLKIHFGTGNSEAEDYYFIQLGDIRATSPSGLRIAGDAKNDIWGTVGTHSGPNTTGCCGGGIPSLNEPVEGWNSGDIFAYGYNWDWKENDDVDLNRGRYVAGAYQADGSPTLQELLDAVNRGSQARVRIDFETGATTNDLLGAEDSRVLATSADVYALSALGYYKSGSSYTAVPSLTLTQDIIDALAGQTPAVTSGALLAGNTYKESFVLSTGIIDALKSASPSITDSELVVGNKYSGAIVLTSGILDAMVANGVTPTAAMVSGASYTSAAGFVLTADIITELAKEPNEITRGSLMVGNTYSNSKGVKLTTDLITEIGKTTGPLEVGNRYNTAIKLDKATIAALGLKENTWVKGDTFVDPIVQEGAHRICLGNEIYYVGSATLGKSANQPDKVAYSMMNAEVDGSSVSGDTWAISALAAAINGNPKSDYWAKVETFEYRSGYTSLYVFAKEGGDKKDVSACDEQLGAIRGSATQSELVKWYNDEMEADTEEGTYFNNGGKYWGTLKTIPTGYGSWGVQLEGQDVGDERDLWILNVGSGESFDIRTDEWGMTGKGFGQRTDGTAVTNLLGLDRQSFVEIQNAADGDWAGAHVRTQSHAQEALDAIQGAIERKDKIRATLGAYQNRLENTITNMEIYAENLQSAESRISDADMATEMTTFVKNQVLTQAAISMLSQANSLPQMALSLLNG